MSETNLAVTGEGGESLAPSPSSPAVHTRRESDYDSSALLEISESAQEAGCYTFVGESFSVDENHQSLTDSIRREADPRYVPLLCKRVYLTPAGTEMNRTYFVVGRYIEFPTEEYKDDAIRLSYVPRGFPFDSTKIHAMRTLWAPWDTRDSEGKYHHPVEYSNATPPEVVEIGPWLLSQMNALRKFFDTTIRIEGDDISSADFESDKLRTILELETEADSRRMAAAREEARYRMRHNWQQMKVALDNGRIASEPPSTPIHFDLGKKG